MNGASTLSIGSSLRQRALTAFILGPLVLAAVLWLPTPGFALFLGLVTLGAAWEWAPLAGLERRYDRIGYLAFIGILLLCLWLLPGLRLWVMGVAAAWWILQTLHLARLREVPPKAGVQVSDLGSGVLVLAAPWAALVALHQIDPQGPVLVLFLMALVWTADSLAYFVGRRFGRIKLAPRISPGKTREGVYGALVGAVLWGLLYGWIRSIGLSGTLLAALLCVLTVLVSVVGDLYESLLKRGRGLKDSSHLLPGHGGLLDRVDSLTAAAPVFVLGLAVIGDPP